MILQNKVWAHFYVGPVIDCHCAGVGPEATIGDRSWLASRVENIDQSLRGEVGVQRKVDKIWVHDEG